MKPLMNKVIGNKVVKEIIENYIPVMLNCALLALCLVFLFFYMIIIIDGTEKVKYVVSGEIIDIQEHPITEVKKNYVKVYAYYDVTIKLNDDEKVIFKKVLDFSDYEIGDCINLQCIEKYLYNGFMEKEYEIMKD